MKSAVDGFMLPSTFMSYTTGKFCEKEVLVMGKFSRIIKTAVRIKKSLTLIFESAFKVKINWD